jgi:hypothetical protein
MDSALELVGVMTRLDTNNEKDIPILPICQAFSGLYYHIQEFFLCQL